MQASRAHVCGVPGCGQSFPYLLDLTKHLKQHSAQHLEDCASIKHLLASVATQTSLSSVASTGSVVNGTFSSTTPAPYTSLPLLSHSASTRHQSVPSTQPPVQHPWSRIRLPTQPTTITVSMAPRGEKRSSVHISELLSRSKAAHPDGTTAIAAPRDGVLQPALKRPKNTSSLIEESSFTNRFGEKDFDTAVKSGYVDIKWMVDYEKHGDQLARGASLLSSSSSSSSSTMSTLAFRSPTWALADQATGQADSHTSKNSTEHSDLGNNMPTSGSRTKAISFTNLAQSSKQRSEKKTSETLALPSKSGIRRQTPFVYIPIITKSSSRQSPLALTSQTTATGVRDNNSDRSNGYATTSSVSSLTSVDSLENDFTSTTVNTLNTSNSSFQNARKKSSLSRQAKKKVPTGTDTDNISGIQQDSNPTKVSAVSLDIPSKSVSVPGPSSSGINNSRSSRRRTPTAESMGKPLTHVTATKVTSISLGTSKSSKSLRTITPPLPSQPLTITTTAAADIIGIKQEHDDKLHSKIPSLPALPAVISPTAATMPARQGLRSRSLTRPPSPARTSPFFSPTPPPRSGSATRGSSQETSKRGTPHPQTENGKSDSKNASKRVRACLWGFYPDELSAKVKVEEESSGKAAAGSHNLRPRTTTPTVTGPVPLLSSNCKAYFHSRLSLVEHYMEHIAQVGALMPAKPNPGGSLSKAPAKLPVAGPGPILICPVSTCRMVALSKPLLDSHLERFHPSIKPEAGRGRVDERSSQASTPTIRAPKKEESSRARTPASSRDPSNTRQSGRQRTTPTPTPTISSRSTPVPKQARGKRSASPSPVRVESGQRQLPPKSTNGGKRNGIVE
ncbi:hypothetical protein BGW38_002004 [Lunasporangiospora selenospora]|uniref:C2H2-type domain-containing protein n=1 Tax=Lunasporangiospora selenospora TaxID=979761 RepID=A0A9P6G3A2_9FUNG|nr:hypothetical protein BGW38_002004 [Lunasporangiospora selenospora]